MALRSLHQSYEIPVARLAAIDMKASAKKRRAFMKQWDVRKYMPEHNPQLRAKLGIGEQR